MDSLKMMPKVQLQIQPTFNKRLLVTSSTLKSAKSIKKFKTNLKLQFQVPKGKANLTTKRAKRLKLIPDNS